MTYDLVMQFCQLLGVHFIADFVLQTDWQAQNKSKNNRALFDHVATYTCVLGGFCAARWGFAWGVAAYVATNGVMHFATDYVTSRVNAWFYARGDRHSFFVGIGLDQYVHQLTLAATMPMLVWR